MASGSISAYKRGERVGQGAWMNHLKNRNIYFTSLFIFFLSSPLMYLAPLSSTISCYSDFVQKHIHNVPFSIGLRS